MYAARCEQRKATSAPTSSGSPSRPAAVVDQDVDPLEPLRDLLEERGAIGVARDVAGTVEDRDVPLLRDRGRLVAQGLCLPRGERKRAAFRGERPGARAAHPLARA